MADYYAHVRETGERQTVKEHLDGTAKLASEFAAEFNSADQGKLMGMAHDIGKYSKEFQRRLLYGGPKVDHASAGAHESVKINQPYAAICISGHHSGLPDLGSIDDLEEGTFWGKINRARRNMIPEYFSWSKDIRLPEATLPDYITCKPDPLNDMFYIRMLYSCLVDADFLDTEEYMRGASRGIQGDTIEVLYKKLLLKIEDNGWLKPSGALNGKRSEILQNCIDKAECPKGIFTLSVPTGGGKTISSLAFALKHDARNNMKRIIYVIPYTSIIDQTAEVFREVLGRENVLEHHSGVDYASEDCVDEVDLRMCLASENWDAPVIVTTAVQFFESLFSSKNSKCRKLHNIANSVVIFDEAQMLPVPYLRPCIYSMAQLTKNYKVSIVLCTATQPALEHLFREFIDKYEPIELCPPHILQDPVFKRASIEKVGDMDWGEVADYMNSKDQILCIVNSRASARKVYGLLQGEGVYHLSTLMIPVHRKEKLREIRDRLRSGKKCRVVSTSLIEAGVDVDFPVVLREETGLDSVIQAAGRCNREGKRPAEKSVVKVFKPEDNPPAIFRTNIDVSRMVMKNYDDLSSNDAIKEYFNKLFSFKGQQAFDKADVIQTIKGRSFPFKTIADRFHLIDSKTQAVMIPTGYGEELLERKMNGEVNRNLFREMNQYQVNIYENHLKALIETDDVRALDDGTWYLRNLDLYKPDTGLSLESDCGKAEFI